MKTKTIVCRCSSFVDIPQRFAMRIKTGCKLRLYRRVKRYPQKRYALYILSPDALPGDSGAFRRWAAAVARFPNVFDKRNAAMPMPRPFPSPPAHHPGRSARINKTNGKTTQTEMGVVVAAACVLYELQWFVATRRARTRAPLAFCSVRIDRR